MDSATLHSWSQIKIVGGEAGPVAAAGPSVIGGAFRSTSRVSIARSTSTKGTTLLGFSFESPTFPQQGMAATLGAGAAIATSVQITAINKVAAAHTFPTFTTTKWASKDGKSIEGILLLPPGFDPKDSKPAPLVVFTHCGPAMAVTATHLGYGSVCARFPLAQLAEAGYLVLQPNYRGSTGYGKDFRMSDRGDWGGNDYNDVFSGAANLIKLGYTTASQVSHMGWSYGGYMSALAMGTVQDNYGFPLQKIVTGGTLSDLISHTGTTDITKIIKSWAGGYHWDSPDLRAMMTAHSGIYHVEKATAPTLMFHGANDPRMPISQSFQLHYALKSRGIPVRFLTFPGSGHIPGDPNQIKTVWDETLAWLAPAAAAKDGSGSPVVV